MEWKGILLTESELFTSIEAVCPFLGGGEVCSDVNRLMISVSESLCHQFVMKNG